MLKALGIALIWLTRCRRSGDPDRAGLSLAWVCSALEDTDCVHFQLLWHCYFFSFSTGPESEVAPMWRWLGGVSSFINPIWHKAVSHIVGIAESLQQSPTQGTTWQHQRRPFPAPTPRERESSWVTLVSSFWTHFIWEKLPLNEAHVPQSPFYLLLSIHQRHISSSAWKWVASSNYSRLSSLFWLHYKL